MLQIAQNLPLAQLVAYVALTCAGVTVAIVSLSFSYRQNFGWPPSAIIWSHGLKGGGGDPRVKATFEIDFWNRRTYSVLVAAVEVEFENLVIDWASKLSTDKGGWHFTTQNRAIWRGRSVVDPKSLFHWELQAPMMPEQSLDAIDTTIRVTVHWFDPRKQKRMSRSFSHRFCPSRPFGK
jgi:hypothetical protein